MKIFLCFSVKTLAAPKALNLCQTLNRTYATAANPALMASPPPLLGPPEVYTGIPKPAPTDAPPSNPFVDQMLNKFNSISNYPYGPPPNMAWTENCSPTFLSSCDPCLDFFFHVVPDTPAESLTQRLHSAWDKDPSTALKLVFNLRGLRGTGKSDRNGFYTAALWIHKNHPKTLACNIPCLVDFGYFKDSLQILYRLLGDQDIQEKPREKHSMRLCRRVRGLKPSKEVDKEKMVEEKQEKRIAMAKKVLERYSSDAEFRFLHQQVSDLFAAFLAADLEKLKSGEKNLSLAAKWCPSLYSKFDRATLICESIARKLFPREKHPEYDGLEEAHYAYRVRDRLRKEVLVPLRRVLELPEVFIGTKSWDLINYRRVASLAMKLHKETFLKFDGERFKKFLEDVKSGKSKIAAGALLPHEIVNEVRCYYSPDAREVAELQWKRIVDDLLKLGKLRNCMAISDVSGSMNGTPIDVSVAMGILVSELSEEPWKGKLITFSESPEIHALEGDELKSKIHFVERMDWNMNTDFQKVFDKILQVAVGGNLKPEEMVKRLFVFSDMEFDEASSRPWETDYEAIVRKFREKGYGEVIPQIVFWNLRDSKSTPVLANQKGVALVSGFSKNILKLFLDEDGDIDPVKVMKKAISGTEYDKLVVVD